MMKDYIDLVSYSLSSSIIYAFLGFLAGILIVYSLNHLRYLKRKTFIFQVITKTYFVWFPIIFFIYFWFVGSIWITMNLIRKTADETMIQIKDIAYPAFASDINERIEGFLKLEKIPSNAEIVDLYLEENTNENQIRIYRYILRMSLIKILEITLGKDNEEEVRASALSMGISKTFVDAWVGKIQEEINKRIKGVLIVLLISITCLFLLALSFPALEIYFSVRYSKKHI